MASAPCFRLPQRHRLLRERNAAPGRVEVMRTVSARRRQAHPAGRLRLYRRLAFYPLPVCGGEG